MVIRTLTNIQNKFSGIFQKLSIFIMFNFFSLLVYSQNGKLVGKVVSTTGEEIIGAVIMLEGTQKGAQTDFNGEYSIINIAPGKYNASCRYVGYNTKVSQVIISKNASTEQNFVIEEKSNVIQEVTITAKAKKENLNSLLIQQKNAASVSDGISAESIKRSPDKSTSDVLKRVSGASIQDNKFAIIRGLNERYNGAYINSAPLPSSESDRKAFAFDIFPSNMLDNLIITKTATPDQSGEFAGGLILVNTKSIPDENFQSISFGTGINSITTFKEKLDYNGGKFDFLGIDDGTRNVPASLPPRNSWPETREEKASAARLMPNDWATNKSTYSPNYSFQYTMGKNFKKNEKDIFGILFSLSYNKSYSWYETFLYAYDQANGNILETNLSDQTNSDRTLGGALFNVSYKINNKNSISFKNLYSINSEDRFIAREGFFFLNTIQPLGTQAKAFWFTSNNIYSNQLIGEHYIEKTKTKITWNASTGNVKRSIPGLRRMSRFANNGETYSANIALGPDFGVGTAGTYFYSNTSENINSFQADMTENVDLTKQFKNTIKIGYGYQVRKRDFLARKLNLAKYNQTGGGGIEFDDSLVNLPDDQIFNEKNIGILPNGKGGFLLEQIVNPYDAYDASSSIFSRYIMIDSRYKQRSRLVWGVRLETFVQKLNSTRDDRTPVNLNTTTSDFLPSLNYVYSISENQNLRLSYSNTVNRPEFRELAPFVFYDFGNRYTYSGNDSLVRCKVYNYDLRYELFPGRNQILSTSLFYKKFINPVEQKANPNYVREVTYINANSAVCYGAELEFRFILGALSKKETSILNDFTVFSNFAYIKSNVVINESDKTIDKDRQLQGQSPYVINSGIQFQNYKSGFSATASLNSVGDRIYIVGSINEPDLWEKGRTVLDFQVSKLLMKNKLEIRLNVKDVFAQKLVFYNDIDNNKRFNENPDLKIISRNFGQEVSFNISYKF